MKTLEPEQTVSMQRSCGLLGFYRCKTCIYSTKDAAFRMSIAAEEILARTSVLDSIAKVVTGVRDGGEVGAVDGALVGDNQFGEGVPETVTRKRGGVDVLHQRALVLPCCLTLLTVGHDDGTLVKEVVAKVVVEIIVVWYVLGWR